MKNDNDKAMIQEQDPFTIDYFRPEDAEGIVRLFRAVYGEDYPIRLFYDPTAIIAANEEGRYYSICARTATGEVVGVMHLHRSAPCPSLYETGAGLVMKEYRKANLGKRMLALQYDALVPSHRHIEEVFGEPVCNHTVMQKAIETFHFVETAIEVALMPASVYTREKSASGRVATTMGFRCYKPKPHRVFLPPSYEKELRWIYGRLDDARDLLPAEGKLPESRTTQADMTVFDFAQVARIALAETGGDLKDCLSRLEEQAHKQKAVVFQAWLNLTEPWVGEAVHILRQQGYFFGGPLPRWFDGDGLLMQKLLCPPDFEDIILESDFAKELLEFIRKDRQWCKGVTA